MAYKQYPVRIYYYNEGLTPKYFHDKWSASSEAFRYAQRMKTDVSVYYFEFPRTLNAEVAFNLMHGKLDKYPRKKWTTEFYYGAKTQEAPKSQAKADGIPSDPWVLLGVKWGSTKDEVRSAWIKKVKEHHPDNGGQKEWAQAVNAAKDKIYFTNGWS